MKVFQPMYDKTLAMASHRHAQWYLGGVSFAESSFFPIPVDVMLAPMALKKPNEWVKFASIAAIFSVLGGVFGYLLGWLFWDSAQQWVESLGWMPKYEFAVNKIEEWGVWIVFLAGFTPMPYKVMTIAAGTMNMAIIPFVLASIVGRGARFFLVAGLAAWLGPKIEDKLHKYIEWIGWSCLVITIVIYLVYKSSSGINI